MTGRLEGKVAVVTGGARGIGRATVTTFLEEGARVTVVDLDGEGADHVAQQHPDRTLAVQGDITREDDVRSAVRRTVEHFGGLDVLVNNAGRNAYGDATAMTQDEWDAVFAVDLKGAWLVAKHALPVMIERAGGAIVNIASIHARLTTRGMFPYAAAKSGLVGLTRSLALDYADRGIRVNAVCPGWTRTRLVQEWFDRQPDPDTAQGEVLEAHPLGRIADPAEIAAVVTFVASEDASFMTGTEVYVDGGLGARYA